MRFPKAIPFMVALTCAPTLSAAQVTQAKFDSVVTVLTTRIAQLEKATGMSYLNGPQIPCEEMESARPPADREFPNGEYNNSFTIRQLACWIHLKGNPELARLPASGTVQSYVNAAVASVSMIPGIQGIQGPPGPQGPAGSGGGLGSVLPTITLGNGFLLKDAESASHAIFTSDGDDGFRILFNHRDCWYNCAAGQGVTHSKYNLPQLRLDFEQDGAIGFGYQPRLGISKGPYDLLLGKDILMRPGGQTSEAGPRTEWAKIFSGLVGRGLELGTSDSYPGGPSPKIRLKGDGGADPVWLFVGGALRQVKVCNVGGVNVFCF